MTASVRKILQVPVAILMFFVAGILSLLLLLWMAVVSVGLMLRKILLATSQRMKGGRPAKDA